MVLPLGSVPKHEKMISGAKDFSERRVLGVN